MRNTVLSPPGVAHPVAMFGGASVASIGGGSAPWTPAQLPGIASGLFLWLNPANVQTNAGLITQANALYGSIITANASIGLGPTSQSDGAQFGLLGTDTMTLSSPFVFPLNSPFTIYAIGTIASGSEGWLPLASSSTSCLIIGGTTGGVTLDDDNGSGPTLTGNATGQILTRIDYTSGNSCTVAATGTNSTASMALTGSCTLDSIGNDPGNTFPNDNTGNRILLLCILPSDIAGTSDDTNFLAWIAANFGGLKLGT